jgi:hypothetical protein
MSEKPPNYSDPEDKVDYQVIKSSYGRANKTSARNNLYFLVALTIIVLLCAMVFFQSLKIGDLKEEYKQAPTKLFFKEIDLDTGGWYSVSGQSESSSSDAV